MKKIILLLAICIISLSNSYIYAEELYSNNTGTLNCNTTLSYNSKGSQVKILQKQLNKTVSCNLTVDGHFGQKTLECLKKFQTKYNLDADGIVGPKTCSKLNVFYKLTIKSSVTSTIKKGIGSSSLIKGITTNTKYIVTADILNVRAKAGTDSTMVKKLKQASIVTRADSSTTSKNGQSWYKIKYAENSYGYVSTNYIKEFDSYIKNNTILVDISEQNLKLYKNGILNMNVPVVTGYKEKHDTPTGIYTLEKKNKETSRTLRGYNPDGTLNYSAYVDYWMPFIMSRGIGFHDASWRASSEFTKTRYTYDGSHGCINMKKADAKNLFNSITQDIKVVIID